MSTILIGVDHSARSEDAVAFAQQLAHASSAHVVVVCAFPYEEDPGRGGNLDYRGALREDAHGTVRRMSGLLEGVPAERVRTGVVGCMSPARALHQFAESEHAALVIVGSTHTGTLGRVMPGSTAERLLQGAPCAVAVVPTDYRVRPDHPLRRIGVAFDGSLESRAALAAAVDVAAAARGASLAVITVIPADIYSAPAMMGGPSSVTLKADLKAGAQERLDSALADVPSEIPTEAVVLEGHPWHELGDYSAGLDLLFAGSRGYGPLHSVLAGGTSGMLVRHAHCPVIVTPRGASTALGDLFRTATHSA